MGTLRVGIIGGGGIAQTHLPRLRQRSDVAEVVALADVNRTAAETVAKKFEIPRIVSDYQELLGLVDAVLICVPTHLHAPIAVDCLKAGKQVFCEKPLARTMEQADAIAVAVRESGAAFQVGFVRRFDRGWLSWREAILAERIGRPVVWRGVQSSPPFGIPWFTAEEQGGGPFLDGCVHNYDFALHTFGPAAWVFAHLRTIHPLHTALDTGTATVRFASGDELLLSWSWGLPTGTKPFGRMDFLGPAGQISFPTDRPGICIDRGGALETVDFPRESLTQAFEAQMDEFLDVARGLRQPRAGLAEGRASLELGLAVLESGRRGGEKIHLLERA